MSKTDIGRDRPDYGVNPAYKTLVVTPITLSAKPLLVHGRIK